MPVYTVTGKVFQFTNGWTKVVEGYWYISIVPGRTTLLTKTSWHNPQYKILDNFADNPLILYEAYVIRTGHYFKFKEIK